MAKKQKKKGTGGNEHSKKSQENNGALSRREFVKKGAVAGLGAAALAGKAQAQAQETNSGSIVWDYEADVVIAGGG